MNAKQFLDKHGRDVASEVAEKAGTNIAYFSQLAHGHRCPSRKLALRLVEASAGEMTFVALMMPAEQQEAA